MVVYLADVSERRVETCDHRHRHILKQVVRVAVEELDRASDALVEESKVKAHIEIVVGFPSEVFVAQRRYVTCRVAHIFVRIGHEVHISIVGRRQRAVNAIRSTQLQFVYPCGVLQELFFVQSPSARHRPEVAPTGVRTEF